MSRPTASAASTTGMTRRLAARAGLLLTLAAATTGLAACDISKDSASSQLSAQFSSNSLTSDPAALAKCFTDKLYDSGKFTNDEIQTYLKTADSQLPADLLKRINDNVKVPCGIGTGSSTATSSASTTETTTATTTASSSS